MGTSESKISDISFKYLYELGCIDRIVKIHGLLVPKDKRKFPIFNDFVNVNYALRKEDKENDLIYKLFLNGLYGKFGQKVVQSTFLINPNKKTVENEKKFVFYNKNFLHEGEQDLNQRSLVFSRFDIAGRITEKARILMSEYRNMIRDKGGKIYYQDTDSIQGDFDLEEMGLENIFSNTELGLLKKENEGVGVLNGVIIGQKVYRYSDDFKASKGVKNMSAWDYRGLANSLHRRNILKGINSPKKFYVYKGSLLSLCGHNAFFYNQR